MGLSYTDAVLLMGGRNSRTVAVLNRLTGGLLLVASAAGAGFALSLFEPRSELAQLSDELVRDLGQRIRGLDRFTRSERVAAAHSVVVLSAYFDVLAGAELPFAAKELELTKAEQVALAGGEPPGSDRLRALANGLLRAEVPMPVGHRPYEATLEAMRSFYRNLSGEVSRFVSGLAMWDRLDDTQRVRMATVLSDELPGRAVLRYEERFRQLAVEFPEIAFWSNLLNHEATQKEVEATQKEIRQLGTGMVSLERMLADIAAGRVPDDRRLELSRGYQTVLQRPVLTIEDLPAGWRLPLLGDAYVNPDFRAVEAVGPEERFTNESRWRAQPVREDLEEFLFGYLISPQAVKAPLLVLGEPGSGKSVLTQMLAARLPPDKFLVVRVVLREFAADADLQTQIEDAIRSATGESLTWPALARSADGALPIVLLDGFDELLQATGVNHTDYLRKAAEFQTREAGLNRPVAILVTSRTAVADRAKLPQGTVVARLEPFREAQISQWLRVWNNTNTGLRPLTLETVLEHPELASQPLLLIMLALYNADGNPLQSATAALGEAELYERLLVSFAEREIRKSDADMPDRQFRDEVQRELLRLSVVAFGMFSRNRQWITDVELNADLPALLSAPGIKANPPGLRAPLSAAQVVVGRFFFIHEAQATRDDTRLHTYEFLHATFGEYLIARLVTHELEDLADAAQFAADRNRPEPAADAFLRALLSYIPLTMRGTIVSFAAERIRALPEARRLQLSTVLLELFGDAFGQHHDTRYEDYIPQPITVPAQYAAYSANLALLAVLAAGQATGGSLFPAARDPVTEWRDIALLWRSQLPLEGWAGLIDIVALDRVWLSDRRDIVLRYRKGAGQPSGGFDPYWSYNITLSDEGRALGDAFGWRPNSDNWLREQAWFLCDQDNDTSAIALEPFAGDFDGLICCFHSYWPDEDRAVSTVNALITLWLASGSDCTPEELAAAYDTSLEIAMRARFGPHLSEIPKRFRLLVLRQLAADQLRLPRSWLDSVSARIREAVNDPLFRLDEAAEVAEFLRMANKFLPELMATSLPDTAQHSDL